MHSRRPITLQDIEDEKRDIAHQAAEQQIYQVLPEWYAKLAYVTRLASSIVLTGIGFALQNAQGSDEGMTLVSQLLFTISGIILLPLRLVAKVISSIKFQKQLPDELKHRHERVQTAYKKRLIDFAIYAAVGTIIILTILLVALNKS